MEMEKSSRTPYRPRCTPEQIGQLLDKFEQSGQTVQAFVTAEGLALSTFQQWRRQRRRRTELPTSAGPNSPPFVEVNHAALFPVTGVAAQVRFADGLTIEVKEGLSVELLAQLVQQLRRA